MYLYCPFCCKDFNGEQRFHVRKCCDKFFFTIMSSHACLEITVANYKVYFYTNGEYYHSIIFSNYKYILDILAPIELDFSNLVQSIETILVFQ